MSSRKVDLDKLRVALRKLKRGDLLIIAERALETVPRSKLETLVGDMIRLRDFAEGSSGAAALLGEVRHFHAQSLAGEYYESFAVDSRNFMSISEGTEVFVAEFDRLLGRCIAAALNGPQGPAREAFDMLFALLRRIDLGSDDVIFFADEGVSWQVGVDWREALPAYFKCLAASASSEEFAREVDRAIKDFADYDRSKHLTAARRVASAEQKAALKRLADPRRKR